MFKELGLNCLTRNFCSKNDFLWLLAYVSVWLSPIALAWCVAASGRLFSYVGVAWQLENLSLIAMAMSLAAVSALVTGWGTLYATKHFFSSHWKITPGFDHVDQLLIAAIALISGVGLFLSFGGTIFEKGYQGPVKAWLGYGAWSVTFLLATFLLICDYLARYEFSFRVAGLYLLVVSPFLLCGSRIDFLSGMLAALALCCADRRNSLRTRLLQFGLLSTLSLIVSIAIAKVRYSLYEAGIPIQNIWSTSGALGEMLYLSTLGDIAASLFQVVGHLEQGNLPIVGVTDFLHNYLVRMLPGIWFSDRPVDFLVLVPEVPGGGALHALGEGYLIAGLWGCVLVGAIIGGFQGISVAAKDIWRECGDPYCGLIFLFPWLLLIRGGWYQFFSFFKTLEIIGLLLLGLTILAVIRSRFFYKCRT